jgi:hypothetical protein
LHIIFSTPILYQIDIRLYITTVFYRFHVSLYFYIISKQEKFVVIKFSTKLVNKMDEHKGSKDGAVC